MEEVTLVIPEEDCNTVGCSPHRVIADNGFTYEIVCARCGNLMD